MSHMCVYCGVPATQLDHVVPRRVFRRALATATAVVLPRSLVEDPVRPAGVAVADWTVPACGKCNLHAGSKVDATLSARIERVRARIVNGPRKRVRSH